MKNILAVNSNNLTMTSLEISELVNSRHDKVKQSIERLADRGVISLPLLGEVKIQRERRVESVEVFIFEGQKGKRDSLIAVAQLCPEFTAVIVDRWQELEHKHQYAIPTTLSEALRLAADIQDQKDKAEAALAIAAPKADALDRMTLADGEVCLQTAGKLLQQPPNKFIAWLRSLGTWIFKRQGGRISAYSDKINAGYLSVRTTTTIMPDGSERVREQVVVTPKGLAKLSMMLGVQPDLLGGV